MPLSEGIKYASRKAASCGNIWVGELKRGSTVKGGGDTGLLGSKISMKFKISAIRQLPWRNRRLNIGAKWRMN